MCLADWLALKCFWWKEATEQQFVNPWRRQQHNYVEVSEFVLRTCERSPGVQTSSQVKMKGTNASSGESAELCYQLRFHFRKVFRTYQHALCSGINTDVRQIFYGLVSVYRRKQHVNLLSKTHYTGDVFRLSSSHHQAYVNVRTLTKHRVCLYEILVVCCQTADRKMSLKCWQSSS
jgi:hypothetical protein